MPSLQQLIANVKNPFLGDIFAFDPGETTGFAWFLEGTLIESGQLNTKTVKDTVESIDALRHKALLAKTRGKVRVAIENYVIYSHKIDTHKWSNVHTIKVVGLLEAFAERNNFEYKLRMAAEAKGFVTDELLQEWGFWKKGERHARDAIRHGVMQILFP